MAAPPCWIGLKNERYPIVAALARPTEGRQVEMRRHIAQPFSDSRDDKLRSSFRNQIIRPGTARLSSTYPDYLGRRSEQQVKMVTRLRRTAAIWIRLCRIWVNMRNTRSEYFTSAVPSITDIARTFPNDR